MSRQIWFFVLAVAAQVQGVTTWYVDVDTCPAPGSGTQADPYCSIQTGINAAADGDTVVVAPGFYSETIDFLGKAITVQSTGGPVATTINGGGSGTTVRFVNLEDLDTVFTGFTITGGNAVEGGGMLIEFSGPLIADCVFDDNQATRGAGAFIVGSTATFANCTFTGNNAESGGALYSNASSALITGCTFSANAAQSSGGAAYCTNFSNVSFGGCTFNINFAIQGGAIASTSFSDTVISECTYSGNLARFGGAMSNSSSNPNIADTEFTANTVNETAHGGAIYNTNSSPNIFNCTFTANAASGPASILAGLGGAIYSINNSAPMITACTFVDNTASGISSGGRGGGFYQESGSATLTGCTFSANSAVSTSGNSQNALGGAIYTSATVVASNCAFNDNTAEGVLSPGGRVGGAIYATGSGIALKDCTFTVNHADTNGGAVYNTAATKITSCTFAQNVAVLGSSIYNSSDSADATVTNCAFVGNITGVSGGIYNDDADPKVTNCIFSGNTAASFGGGIFNFGDADPIIKNCTFAGNDAFTGAGVHNFSSTSNPTISNCIVWGNTNTSGASIAGNGTPTVTFSDIEGGFAGGNINANPSFIDADGPDDTSGTLDDDLRLSADSPCIDAGSNAAVPADAADLDGDGNTSEQVPYDLVGNPRIVDGDSIGAVTVDMGAYERCPACGKPTPCPWDLNGDGTVGIGDFLALLAAWGPNPGHPADFNGDDYVGINDFLSLLIHWGPCP